MNKNTFTTVKLAKGEMNIYDFGTVKLHAYKTNDFIDDEVFIVEKNGKAVVIESPCFFGNNRELDEYLKDVTVEGILELTTVQEQHSFPMFRNMQHRMQRNTLKTAAERP